jgi:hypothetical protein
MGRAEGRALRQRPRTRTIEADIAGGSHLRKAAYNQIVMASAVTRIRNSDMLNCRFGEKKSLPMKVKRTPAATGSTNRIKMKRRGFILDGKAAHW